MLVPPGEVLLEEFLRPMGISQYRLALAIDLWRACCPPSSRFSPPDLVSVCGDARQTRLSSVSRAGRWRCIAIAERDRLLAEPGVREELDAFFDNLRDPSPPPERDWP